MSETTAEKEKLAIVMFSGDLDRALAGFFLATTAASMGMQVKMFFTFWGLNIIKKKEGSLKSKGFLPRMMNIINRGGSNRLTLSKYNFLGMGTLMMKKMMKDVKVPTLDEFIDMARQMGVEFIACTTTCGLMGKLDEKAFRSETDFMAGAAYFLGEAKDSKVVLFI